MKLWCCGCNDYVEAKLCGGDSIYPHRPDLYKLNFYQCPHCKNYVGTHNKVGVWQCQNSNDPDNVCIASGYLFNDDVLNYINRTRKALDYAIGVIQTVAKMSDKLSREYGETLIEQLDNIQAYCWQEGYVLTHKEDLERAITALEQKDK